MAFLVPRDPLTPARKLALGLDPARKIVRAEELGALRSAEDAVALANAQADAIRQQAQEAYEAERRRGYEEGKEEARLEQAEQMIENVSRTIDYFGKVEGRMVDLVMQAVQKIVSDFDDEERVLITVRNVLSVVRNQKQMTLRLPPQQVETVKARVNELLADYPGVGYLDIVADSRLKADACILESEIGLVEASMEGQLAALRSAFQKVLGSRV
ncbi:MAG TPA: HrpE/YscL family type III secretion apparatus protein [Ramlibacter sp.]|jgi:type III secretion protein L|uniref:HrpE/YscL family type III secretion apparatus protein n=1 Tax=Ramlibacter sp. TaxID=1917967 RepID=UPI002D32AF14|nr:HrpE/YscL family type III secretion apparatus protein [Ramlibacter sp.]HZY20513.1 HrpE/YscL family type III secretion apparatus protein [Ramlibacter sp.]